LNHRRSLLIALCCVAAAACGKKEQPAPTTGAAPAATQTASEDVVRVGSVAPLTGPQASLGKDNENGARMAFDEASAQGLMIGGKKVKFEMISEDDQTDPRTATVVAQKLADQKVKGVIGHMNSGTSIPASKIYSDAGIPQISPSATAIPYTGQGYKTAFRVMANDEQQGAVLGNYAATKMGAKKIAVIDDRTAYGQGLADQFEKTAKAAGAQVVVREYTSDKANDFTAILTSIKGKQPDVIFFGGMYPQGAPMAKQMKRLGLKAKLLGGDGVQTTEFVSIAGADGEGVIASSPGLPVDTMPGGKEFISKYTAKYGAIQLYAPYAYDAAWAMINAMKAANSVEPQTYLPALAKVNFTGVTGQISFDAKGDLQGGPVTLYQLKGGKWEVLETVK
jgi:branched-chain amino acid transport system substrate-binding protein